MMLLLKALRILLSEPPPKGLEMNERESEEENLNKSEISQVFESALKRNSPVNSQAGLGQRSNPHEELSQPTKSALRSEEKTPEKKPGDGRKVTFFEPGSGDENGPSHKEDEFRMPSRSHQQLPAALLPMVPEVAQAVGVSQEHHSTDFSRATLNPVKATATAMIA
ncbi:Double-stranded RNA-binding protein Staufen like protein 1 [Fukomys damarensis]|uniref:Double-stranded RNA-binding protein Staufen like protein 1 n=1 Tax=Fukomys damarensis TaxID=885580 RepID=A0A091DGL7_FUKDA|nr:Double-stranded RNA-binding protein Staufen like protein 1 [Fukomys damarensis]